MQLSQALSVRPEFDFFQTNHSIDLYASAFSVELMSTQFIHFSTNSVLFVNLVSDTSAHYLMTFNFIFATVVFILLRETVQGLCNW